MKWLLVLFSVALPYWTHGETGPLTNFTTVTLYTDPHTWNEADEICKLHGGHLLDITRFSLFSALLTLASEAPWKNIPVGNGPPGWLGLHRQITPLGDRYYSETCEPLEEFKIAYWNTINPYTVMDGDASSFCVHNFVNQTISGTVTSYKHDYTRAQCNEQNRFYCQRVNGPCTFEKISGFRGDTNQDFSPGNDVIYPFESEARCEECCLNTSTIFPHPDLLVVEDCWGYTTTTTECYIHLVIKPFYFDTVTNRVASAGATLSIKRCYASALDTGTYNVQIDDSPLPNTTCGIPVTGISAMTTREVFIYPGQWTWNNAYTICNQHGHDMLKIDQPEDYTALQQIVDKYRHIQHMDAIWLGLHEPDPVNHTDIRVWSDCIAGYTPNWDSNSPPSTDLSDVSLCVAMTTDTSLWYTETCDTMHHVICMGDVGFNRGYSLGQHDATGSGTQLGPYTVTMTTCQEMCSNWTFQHEQCWGYAVKPTTGNLDTECFLFFQNNTGTIVPDNSLTFYYKLSWTDVFMNNTDLSTVIPDMDLLPKSCCEVIGMVSQCPVNVIPTTKTSIPTTMKTEFTLHITRVTWNDADMICKSSGGKLLQIDDVTKRTMLLNYVKDWVAMGITLTGIWTGLVQMNADDPCSLRWSKGCTVPLWTDFTSTSSYFNNINNRCVTVDQNLQFTKTACNNTYMFVCEAEVGACDYSSILNIKCDIGLDGATYSLSTTLTSCMDLCSTQTYLGMECWAATMSGTSTCDLFFYNDPTYCTNINTARKSFDTVFKTCYAASLVPKDNVFSTNSDPIPNHGCDAFIPDSLKVDVCAPITSLTPTLTLSSSTVSPTDEFVSAIQASSSPISTSELASSVSTMYPYIAFTSTMSTEMLSSSDSVQYETLTKATYATSTISTLSVEMSFSPLLTITTAYSTVELISSINSDKFTQDTDTLSSQNSLPLTSAISVSETSTIVPSPSIQTNDFTTSEIHSNTQHPSSAYVLTISTIYEMPSSNSLLSSVTESAFLTTQTAYVIASPMYSTVSSASASIAPATISSSSVPPTTPSITTESTRLQVTARPIYIIPCLCHGNNNTRMTLEEWQEWFVRTNEVDVHKTSRYRRKLTSVHDGRTSTITIGVIASVLILGIALYLVTTDIPHILRGVVLCRRKEYAPPKQEEPEMGSIKT